MFNTLQVSKIVHESHKIVATVGDIFGWEDASASEGVFFQSKLELAHSRDSFLRFGLGCQGKCTTLAGIEMFKREGSPIGDFCSRKFYKIIGNCSSLAPL